MTVQTASANFDLLIITILSNLPYKSHEHIDYLWQGNSIHRKYKSK